MSPKSKGIIASILFLFLLVPAVAFGWNEDSNREKIIRGAVYINQLPVGGMEVNEARKAVEKSLISFPETEVRLNYLSKSWKYKLSELGIAADVDAALTEAQNLGRKGSLPQRIRERWEAATEGKRIEVPITMEKKIALEKFQTIATVLEEDPRNARYTYHQQKVEIIPHIYGKHLDLVKTADRLLAAADETAAKAGTGFSVNLPVDMAYPEVTTQKLKDKSINTVMGAYVTQFNTGQVSRSKNIAMAVKYLDGIVVPPGATFSFNEAVGPRTKGTGFEEALIIVNDEFAPGLGGGVCQVSSTLYNAVLKAGMKIEERSRHSKIIAYVPLGLDAAVSYGYLDLKFTNTTEDYIAICAEVYGGNLSMNILSEKENPYTIEIRAAIESTVEPKTEIKRDPGIAEGKQYLKSPGKKGHVTRVERLWFQGGKEIKRETISRDFYPAEAKVIVKGSQTTKILKPRKAKPSSAAPKPKEEETPEQLLPQEETSPAVELKP